MSGSSSNFGDLSYVSVGTTSTQKARGLVQFDLSSIPERTPIDSALGMYYDQTHTTNANDVELESTASTRRGMRTPSPGIKPRRE